MRPVRLLAAALAAAALLVAPATVVAARPAVATVSGTLELEGGTAPYAAGLAYSFERAPLLHGPDASGRVGLRFRIRDSDTHYAPITLVGLSAPFDAIPNPASCLGFVARPVAKSIAIADPRALLQVEGIRLDLLHGRGEAYASLARVGADELSMGSFAAPGTVRAMTDGCVSTETGEPVPGPDGAPYRDVTDLPAVVEYGSPRLLGPLGAEALGDTTLPLRLRDGAWRGSLAVSAEGSRYGAAFHARIAVALRGTPVALNAFCTIPTRLYGGSGVLDRATALQTLRRAGFTRASYAGTFHSIRSSLWGRHFVANATTSSLPCDLPLQLRRAVA
jgi:hypothetical protein